MIRFNIIGTGFLDFEEGGGLAFKSENPFFRFADVSLGRSVEFTIPATERNRKMLDYGEIVTEYGDMLRRSHECQMVYDGGAMMGTLAVTSYDGDAFKCVFYIQSAPWVDRLQNLKLSDCPIAWTKGIVWDTSTTVVDANAATPSEEVQILRYDNGMGGISLRWQFVPSVNVKQFLLDIFSQLGIHFETSLSDRYWMVAGSMRGGDEDMVTFEASGTTSVNLGQSQNYFSVKDIEVEWARSNFFGVWVGGGSVQTKGFKALKDVEVSFPAFVAKPLFLVRWNSHLRKCEVLGGSLASPVAGIEPLDGRTVSLKKGDIVFFTKSPYYSIDTNGTYMGWKDIAYPMSVATTVSRSQDLEIGETWQLRCNMPEMTVFEFLRSVALATGLEVKVTPAGVTLSEGEYGEEFLGIDCVVSVDSVERIVESWGNDTQMAIVDFDSEDYVTERIKALYPIDNLTRQSEAEHASKFSEGNVGTNGVQILDVEEDSGGGYKFKAKKWTLAYADPNESYLQRVPLPVPVAYDDIAENSTCVKMKVSAGEADFFDLKPQTTLVWRGAAFVWTDANWSGGVLSLTLQCVSQIRQKNIIGPT